MMHINVELRTNQATKVIRMKKVKKQKIAARIFLYKS